jgi:hypothetical protein
MREIIYWAAATGFTVLVLVGIVLLLSGQFTATRVRLAVAQAVLGALALAVADTWPTVIPMAVGVVASLFTAWSAWKTLGHERQIALKEAEIERIEADLAALPKQAGDGS